jgi:hypothetical protein
MGVKIESTGTRPGTLQFDVFQVVFDQLANPQCSIHVRDDLQERVRGFERGLDRGEVCRGVLVSHRPGSHAHRTVVEGADEGAVV